MNPNTTTLFDQSDCTLMPGEMIGQSGVYEICHYDEDRTTVILMRNTVFPYCRQCGERVRYKLLQPVPHISEDPDFREDRPDNPNYLMRIPTSTTFPMQLDKAHGFRFHQDTVQAWRSGPKGGDL